MNGTNGINGEQRREQLLKQLSDSSTPVSGTSLAAAYHVSRQVIVQDIALLRAAGHRILSTNRGYLCQTSLSVTKVFHVRHTNEEIEEELNIMVDCGCTVLDVFVHHKVYGPFRAPLMIHSRKEVQDFLEHIQSGFSAPLNNITSGYHYHTVEADSEEILDLLEQKLQARGFLIK